MTPLKYDNFLVIVSVSVALHAFPMDPTPFKSVFTYQKSFTLGLPTLMECKRQKTASLKKERGMQSFVTQDILAEKGKKKGDLSRRKEGNITFASRIRRFYCMRYRFCSRMISAYAWWMRWHLWNAMTPVECAGRSFSSALFFEYAGQERPTETAKTRQTNQHAKFH